MKNQHIYIKFLTLLHAIEGKGELPELDLDAKRLLEVIAVHHSQSKPLTVSDAMGLGHIASPATIHRKLDLLREIGMIDTVFEGTNRRTKFLVPTEQAHQYFETVGNVMEKAGLAL
jgi:Fe2+ or Zn2+ uptake regulation protein